MFSHGRFRSYVIVGVLPQVVLWPPQCMISESTLCCCSIVEAAHCASLINMVSAGSPN